MGLLVFGTVSQAGLLSAKIVEGDQIVDELFAGGLENAELSHNLEQVGVLVGVHRHVLQMSVLRLKAVSTVSDAVCTLLSCRVILSVPHQVLRTVAYFC